MKTLIQGQDLIDEFITLLSQGGEQQPVSITQSSNAVSKNMALVPMSIQMKLPDIYNPASGSNKYKEIFHGNLSPYGSDHSAADLALCGYLARQGLTSSEADHVFRTSQLCRAKWDEKRGEETYGERTLKKAFSDIQNSAMSAPTISTIKKPILSNITNYRPTYIPQGMPPRQFVGPKICDGIRLFPSNALSTLVALGAMGKTSLLISIASHVAAGKEWNGYPLNQQKSAMFFCEEDQEEVNRKFSALVDSWPANERQAAIDNLLLIPLMGLDTRLTVIDKGHYKGSGVAEEIIELLNQHALKDGLIILDHMQGFTAGDLNISETATAICREANKIVHATGSSVVLAAHIGKNNIKAEEFEQGFAVGSLAFENATRQMSGLIPMTEAIAKKHGLELSRKEYVWFSLAKNSYGGTNEGVWLKKVFSPSFHTIVIEPTTLIIPSPAGKLSEYEKIGQKIIEYINTHLNTTKNNLDALSGKDGYFKCSKAKLRDTLQSLIDCGDILIHKPSEIERQEHSIPKQVKGVLKVNTAKAAVKSAIHSNTKSSMAD
ncbi:AAA family ATPase [Polynucleobacter sp. MG-Unter2-18]|uniref:phage NrS-1 polymerase family protein n=1 Tax=Polynucleobacter sp. MG-Unter2-18 TaxID=2081052 RepID=UPI001BFD810C|nr:AAA family ATPase [Polynucleobacter sp. MG-Unter2-18]QWD95362.1 AAA family ATPase [Polynucleobacter sp. MG-Unter2-18]